MSGHPDRMSGYPAQGPASTVYIATGASGVETDAGTRRRLIDTARAGRHLREFGYRVVLVRQAHAAAGNVARAERSPRPTLDALPDDPNAWLVTADADTCLQARRSGRVRTVLVGPRAPGSSALGRPADLQARNLFDAVLTIVAAEPVPAA